MGAVQTLALQILHTDSPILTIEQNSCGQGIELDAESLWMSPGDLQQAFPATHTGMMSRCQRQVAHPECIGLYDPPVIRIRLGFEHPQESLQRMSTLVQHFESRFEDDLHQRTIPKHDHGQCLLRREPAIKAVPGQVDPKQLLEPAIHRPMLAVLQTLEVLAHVIGLPGGIPGERGDVVPISIVRIEENHGVVGSAAAQGTSTRIEDAIVLFPKVPVPLLLRVLRVVPYEEIPLHRLILRRQGVKNRHVVVLRQTGRSQRKRVATCFKDQNSVSCLGQICRHWPTPGSGANDDVFILRMTMECCSHVSWSLPWQWLKSLQALDESPFVIVAEARFLW